MGVFLKANLGLGRADRRHVVIDEFLCMVIACTLGTDVSHWMFKKSQHGSRSTRFPFKVIWASWYMHAGLLRKRPRF